MSFSVDDFLSQFGKDYRLAEHISVRPSMLSDIDAHRARFNKTHLFTTNNLWSLGKNYDLTSQITYSNNRLTSDNSTRTSYFLPDSTVLTDLSEHAYSKENRLSGDVTLRANTKKLFLENKLLADLRWNDSEMDITGTFPNSQTATTTHGKLSNDLKLIKRSGRKAFTINSYNLYQVKPQRLSVIRENEKQYQEIESSAFFTNTNTSLSFYVNPITISMKLGVVGVVRSMESNLTGVSDTLGMLKNDLSMRYMNLYVSPEMEYKKNGFEAKFSMPISYIPYRYTDNLTEKDHNEDKVMLSPRLFMRYHFTSRLSASVSGSYAQTPLSEQSFYDGLILNNYRNLSQGYIDYKTGNSKSANLSIRYRNPLKALFVNGSVMRSWNYSPRVSNRYFLNEYLLNSYISQDNRSDMWLASGNVSKGLEAIKGIVTLRSSFSNFEGATFQNGIESTYASDSWSITPKITSRIAQWWNVSYELTFAQNWLRMKDIDRVSSYKNISQQLSSYFTPSKKWYLQLTGEHYYNEITQDVSKHFLLADAEFTYSFTGGWEFNLLVRNIFNQSVYSYTSYDGLTSMSREYQIRPRNVVASVFFRF